MSSICNRIRCEWNIVDHKFVILDLDSLDFNCSEPFLKKPFIRLKKKDLDLSTSCVAGTKNPF